MVITSPFSSIKGYVVAKPPWVLFTLCLTGFAITTFTFAYYVERNETLPNLDAHRDFVNFMSHLSKRTLCISTYEQPVQRNDPLIHNFTERDMETTVTIFVSAKISPILQNVTYVEGYVTISDWVSECTISPVEKVKVEFAVPQTSNNETNSQDICVAVTGPRDALEPGIDDMHCKFDPIISPIIIGHIKYKPLNEIPQACVEGAPLSQTEKITYIPTDRNSIHLTQHDRSVINLHLFHTSYFLLVMAITLVCYAMIKGKPVTKHQSLEKIPLEV